MKIFSVALKINIAPENCVNAMLSLNVYLKPPPQTCLKYFSVTPGYKQRGIALKGVKCLGNVWNFNEMTEREFLTMTQHGGFVVASMSDPTIPIRNKKYSEMYKTFEF